MDISSCLICMFKCSEPTGPWIAGCALPVELAEFGRGGDGGGVGGGRGSGFLDRCKRDWSMRHMFFM